MFSAGKEIKPFLCFRRKVDKETCLCLVFEKKNILAHTFTIIQGNIAFDVKKHLCFFLYKISYLIADIYISISMETFGHRKYKV